MSPGTHSVAQPHVTAQLSANTPDDQWERLVVDFLTAEIDHDLTLLNSNDPAERQRAVAEAQLTLEMARQFEPGIEDDKAREALHTLAVELARRAA